MTHRDLIHAHSLGVLLDTPIPEPQTPCREDLLRWDLKAARREITRLQGQLQAALSTKSAFRDLVKDRDHWRTKANELERTLECERTVQARPCERAVSFAWLWWMLIGLAVGIYVGVQSHVAR